MSTKKKVLLIVYIAIIVAVLIVIANKAFAQGTLVKTWKSGIFTYTINDLGTENPIPKKTGNTSEYISGGQLRKRPTLEALDSNSWIYCIQANNSLGSSSEFGTTAAYGVHYRDNVQYIYEIKSNLKLAVAFSGSNPHYVGSAALNSTTGTVTGSTNYYGSNEYYSRRLSLNSSNTRVTQLATTSNNLDYDAAYILARADNSKNGDYKTVAQYALWNIVDKDYSNDAFYQQHRTEIEQLVSEARAFKAYRNEKYTSSGGYKTIDEINSVAASAQWQYNKTNKCYVYGPFTINYGPTLKLNGDILAGIYDLKLSGINKSGQTVDVTNFQFCDKNGGNAKANVVTNYPATGTPFYVRVDNTTYKNFQKLNTLKIYLKAADVKATVFKVQGGVMEYAKWQVIQDSNGKSLRMYSNYGMGYRNGESLTQENQQLYMIYEAELICRKYEIIITTDKDNPSPSPTPSTTPIPTKTPTPKPTPSITPTPSPTPTPTPTTSTPDTTQLYIDISGLVWVDMPQAGKDWGEEEGLYYTNGDYPRPNVLVKLFFKDGTQVREGMNSNGIEVDCTEYGSYRNSFIRRTGDPYETYTDANGRYTFARLPVEGEYYVTFTYDGMTYEPTEFLAGWGGSLPNRISNYLGVPNLIDSSTEESSKVAGENLIVSGYSTVSSVPSSDLTLDQYNRDAFNQRFRTISGPKTTSEREGLLNETLGYANDSLQLAYYTRRDLAGQAKSRLKTTDNLADANPENTITYHETGKALPNYQMTVRTAFTYPFADDEGNVDLTDENNLRYLNHINLGLVKRTPADLALKVETEAGAMTIKDRNKVVKYTEYTSKDDFMIDGTAQVNEYIKQEISAADYEWALHYNDIYKNADNTVYSIDDGKLNVYVLYRIVLQNQSEDAKDIGIINSIYDYIDKNFELLSDQEEINKAVKLFKENIGESISSGNESYSWIKGTGTSVTWTDMGIVDKYHKLCAENLNLTVEKTSRYNDNPAIYLVLKVKENGQILNTTGSNNSNGMENIAEIASYSIMKNGAVAGKVDKDSAPDNATPGVTYTYEDDTDAAPMFRLEVNFEPRTIEGIVWDDVNKDGIYDSPTTNNEIGVNGVTVKIIEYQEDSSGNIVEIERPPLQIVATNADKTQGYIKPLVDSSGKPMTLRTGDSSLGWGNGEYRFNLEGGNYSLKFIYGDEYMLQTNAKYNAQDYQAVNKGTGYVPLSTIYTKSAFATLEDLKARHNDTVVIDGTGTIGDNGTMLDLINQFLVPKNNEGNNPSAITQFTTQSLYEARKWLDENNIPTVVCSNARDRADIRADLIKKVTVLTNNGNRNSVDAELLNKLPRTANVGVNSSYIDSLVKYTKMESVTDIIDISSTDIMQATTKINLGLQERPISNLELDKKVSRIVLKTSDGRALIDTNDASKQANMQKLGNSGDELDSTFINMDQDKMDGATIDMYYTLTVTNKGEEDKLANYVYVTEDGKTLTDALSSTYRDLFGIPYGLNDILPTAANAIFEYVHKNIDYREGDIATYNSDEIINSSTWAKTYENGDLSFARDKLNDLLRSDIARIFYNERDNAQRRINTNTSKVLETTENAETTKGLIPNNSAKIYLHLGTTLAENINGSETDDMIYQNCAEIVRVYSGAGRRSYESVPGNYIPFSDRNEPDSDITGLTSITVPLGQETRAYSAIVIISATILIVGIVVIKKKVLKK